MKKETSLTLEEKIKIYYLPFLREVIRIEDIETLEDLRNAIRNTRILERIAKRHRFSLDEKTILEMKIIVVDYWKYLKEFNEAQKRLDKELEEQREHDELVREAFKKFFEEIRK